MPLISVVIPVHGVEDYLDRCLDSVLGPVGEADGGEADGGEADGGEADRATGGGGSAVSLEVIAVDDASPDGCGAILAARHDSRLRVITNPAAVGPGPARDLGAKEATGEFVWFVDGDDELADGALAAVAGVLTRLRPDVLVVDFANLYPDGSVSPSGGARYLRDSAARPLRGGAAEPPRGGETGTLADHPALIHLTMTAWSKVFRRDFLAGLGVSFGSAGPAPHEDVPVTALALLTAQRIGVLDRVLLPLPPGAPRLLPGRPQRRQLQYLRFLPAGVQLSCRTNRAARPGDAGRLRGGFRAGHLALHHAASAGAQTSPPGVLPPDVGRFPALASRRVPFPSRPARRKVPADRARRLLGVRAP